jgi:hypothetical protein
MNKIKKYIFFSSILLCFLLCGCLGEKGHTMTPEEICDYMNENFKGDFELIDQEIQNDDDNDISTVHLKCSLFPDEIVIATQGYNWVGNEIGWWEIKETNYYYFVYKNQIEKKVAGYIKEWFGDFDYKIVNTTNAENVMCNMKRRYKNLDNYLNASIIIKFYIVIDTRDEETKTAAAAKAQLAEKSDKVEGSLRLFIFLYGDDNFTSLTEEDIKNIDTINSEYFLGGPFVHN